MIWETTRTIPYPDGEMTLRGFAPGVLLACWVLRHAPWTGAYKQRRKEQQSGDSPS